MTTLPGTTHSWLTALVILLVLPGCDGGGTATTTGHPATARAHAESARLLLAADSTDSLEANRGLVARASGTIADSAGAVLADLEAFAFVAGDAPPTVNPSLWRHAALNRPAGLFKVADGIYQLRGFDIANITLIEGATGWIVVDALTSRESAAAAMAFARQHLGDKAVTALVFTHSHADHFGGALGVLREADASDRRVPIVAPAGFMEEATSENVLVGTAMTRRAAYQFGLRLDRSATGLVDTGLGKGLVNGQVGIMQPTLLIERPSQEEVLDGVRFVFHNVPGAEAPAGLTFSLPDRQAFGGGEILAQTMHNLLPVRGAKVRDALRWATYLQDVLDQSAGAEVYFGQHNWPVWGRDRVAAFIKAQRDVYKYTHDQTVRLINAGHTPHEIAGMVRLPRSLQETLGARGYYGDLRHNVRAVYQFYLGAYDGNPAHLDPLPPEDAATRYVELLGGADRIVAVAHAAFDRGDFRWAAELLHHVAMARPGHSEARTLLARTYEEMGYAAEAATWRNSYLTAASELRDGPPRAAPGRRNVLDLLRRTPTARFLEAMAASVDGPAAEGKDLAIDLVLRDAGESYRLWIENAVMHFRRQAPSPGADATLTLPREFFVRLMAGTVGVMDALGNDEVKVTGSRVALLQFLALVEKAPGNFAIVTP